MFKHYEQPCGHCRGMPHRPGQRCHGHVVTFPSIKDPHPHQPEELGLVGRQVPPLEEPFHEPVNGKGIEKQVVLLTSLGVVMTEAINGWIFCESPGSCNNLRQA